MSEDQVSAESGNAEQTETQTETTEASWYGEIDADLKGWVDNKGFDTPAAALTSYRNLEKMFGADKAGRTVVIPGEKAEPAEVDDFFNRLGRPETPDKYDLTLPEDADNDFVGWFRTTAHKNGLTAKQAADMAQAYGEYANERMGTETNAAEAQNQEQLQALKAEWGAAFDTNVSKADVMIQQTGVAEEVLQNMKNGMGGAATVKFFADLYNKVGEGELIIPENKTTFANAPMAPSEAQAKIDALKADKEWVTQYLAGSPSHVKQMDNLQVWANAS